MPPSSSAMLTVCVLEMVAVSFAHRSVLGGVKGLCHLHAYLCDCVMHQMTLCVETASPVMYKASDNTVETAFRVMYNASDDTVETASRVMSNASDDTVC